jgi:hypothetical protein
MPNPILTPLAAVAAFTLFACENHPAERNAPDQLAAPTTTADDATPPEHAPPVVRAQLDADEVAGLIDENAPVTPEPTPDPHHDPTPVDSDEYALSDPPPAASEASDPPTSAPHDPSRAVPIDSDHSAQQRTPQPIRESARRSEPWNGRGTRRAPR